MVDSRPALIVFRSRVKIQIKTTRSLALLTESNFLALTWSSYSVPTVAETPEKAVTVKGVVTAELEGVILFGTKLNTKIE